MRSPDVEIAVTVLPHGQGLPLPAYATDGAAGMDALAAVEADTVLHPGARMAVPTGLAMAIPQGFEVQVRARSGLALNAGLIVPNGPGTIDSDYRGELKVILANISDQPFTITRGMRIAQLLVAPVVRGAWRVVDSLDDTTRGSGGFGSTGRH